LEHRRESWPGPGEAGGEVRSDPAECSGGEGGLPPLPRPAFTGARDCVGAMKSELGSSSGSRSSESNPAGGNRMRARLKLSALASRTCPAGQESQGTESGTTRGHGECRPRAKRRWIGRVNTTPLCVSRSSAYPRGAIPSARPRCLPHWRGGGLLVGLSLLLARLPADHSRTRLPHPARPRLPRPARLRLETAEGVSRHVKESHLISTGHGL
jgi:hypothetical protein